MKQTEPILLGELLKAMVESDGDRDTFDRQKAAYLWGEIVGPTINRATVSRFVEGNTLHVFLNSSVIKSELAFMTGNIIESINSAVGRRIIKKIVIH